MNVSQMSGREVMRSGAAFDHNLSLARIELLADDLGVVPTAAFCDRKKNGFVSRQHLRPAVAALFLALRQGLRRAARSGHLQQSGTGVGREDDDVVGSPYRAARPCTAVAQSD